MSGSLLRLLAVAGLILLNGLFVAAEFALVSSRSSRIAQLAESGNRRALIAQRAIEEPGLFISACQVGITMASLALGWVAEPAFASLMVGSGRYAEANRVSPLRGPRSKASP